MISLHARPGRIGIVFLCLLASITASLGVANWAASAADSAGSVSTHGAGLSSDVDVQPQSPARNAPSKEGNHSSIRIGDFIAGWSSSGASITQDAVAEAPAAAAAATLTVTNTNDGGGGSLRQAIGNAQSNDTINFSLENCPCVITLASELLIAKSLTIQGPGADHLTVSGNNTVRVFNVAAGNINVTLSGLKISNGRGTNNGGGGGLYVAGSGATVNIADSTISDNTSADSNCCGGGGGIFNNGGGTVNITGSTLTNNASSFTQRAGGAIYNDRDATLNIKGSTLSGNTAAERAGGGAIFNIGTLTVVDSLFTGNVARPGFYPSTGGAIYNTSVGQVVVSGSRLTNNTGSDGGAIYNTGAATTFIVIDSTLSGNTTFGGGRGGGAIFNSNGTFTVIGSTLSGNTATTHARNEGGGGIVNMGVLRVVNSTLSGNSARGNVGRGGAIFNGGTGTANVTSSTLAGNSAAAFSGEGGGGISNDATSTLTLKNTIIALNQSVTAGPDLQGSYNTQGYNLVGKIDGGAGMAHGLNGDQVGTAASPLDPLLGPLGDNGGNTFTMALLSGSPAIDKGVAGVRPDTGATLVVDQRGQPRPVDLNGVANAAGGDGTDVGAFEAGTSPPALEVLGMEVTQGIQDLSNSNVLFIKGRRTFVRVHMRALNQTLNGVRAELEVRRTDNNTAANILPFNNGKQVAKEGARADLNSSFNFELPRAFRDGLLQLRFKAVGHVLGRCGGGTSLENGSCLLTLPAPFQQATVLRLDLVPIKYEFFTRPELRDLFQVLDELESTLPVFIVDWRIKPELSRFIKPKSNEQFTDLNIELETNRRLDCVASPDYCGRYELGVMVNGSGSSLNGLANGIPGTVATTYVTDRFTPSHEMGHVLSREHTDYNRQRGILPKENCFPDGVQCIPIPSPSPPDGTISGKHDDTGFFGWDVTHHSSNDSIYRHDAADLMSYGPRRWPSLNTWLNLYERLKAVPSPSLPSEGEQTHASVKSGEPAVLVSGVVSPAQDVGAIRSVYGFNAANAVTPPAAGSYAIRFEDAGGQALSTHSFAPGFAPDGAGGSFVLILPFNANTKRLVLLKNGLMLHSRAASASAPSVTVTSPNGGENLMGPAAQVTWNAVDPDGGQLSYVLQYSTDAGGTWRTIASNLTATSYELDLNTLPGSTQGLVRVLASDGFNTSADQSNATFTIARHAPLVKLQSPDYNRVYGADQVVDMDGFAFDIEDGPIQQGDSFTWTSDRVGVLDTGRSLSATTSALAPGHHKITLAAKDSDNQVGSATTFIYVLKPPAPPALDDAQFFVAQHYVDFLAREPDPSGLAFWTNEIAQCGQNVQCREVKRINVSAAFFLSIEFQQTGYLAYRAHKAAFGDINGKPVPITRAAILQDAQIIGGGMVVNTDGWEQKLEQNKRAYFEQLAASERFAALYPQTMMPEAYVDALNQNAGGPLSPAERNTLIAELRGSAKTRAQALRVVAEDEGLSKAEFNKAFVLMQFFGYLRRDPDSAPDTDFSGYNFWLGKLNEFNGNFINAEMVRAFIDSIEYKQRFGQ